jgi:hypothetical protein
METSVRRFVCIAIVVAWAPIPAAGSPRAQRLASIAIYPGAHPAPERVPQPNHRGTLTLAGVHVARAAAEKYTSDASADAVLAFYRRELQRFGTVTECRDGQNRASSVRIDTASLNNAAVCYPSEFGEGETELKASRGGELAVVTVSGAAHACEFAVVDVQASRRD